MKFSNGMSVTTSDGYTRVLNRWTKGEHDRIYINGGSHSGDGYVDLVDRSAHLYGGLKYQKEIADMILDMFPAESYVPSPERAMVLAYRDLRVALVQDLKANGEDVYNLDGWILESIYRVFVMGTKAYAKKCAYVKKYKNFVKACGTHDVQTDMDYGRYIEICYGSGGRMI